MALNGNFISFQSVVESVYRRAGYQTIDWAEAIEVIAAKAESYLTRLETCDFLKVDQSTLFRWSRRGYLMPVEIGGRRLYRMSDLTAILKGKGHNND